MEGIFCYYLDMPHKIRSNVTVDEEGNYIIYINSRLSYSQQLKGYIHEIRHILDKDLYRDSSVNIIEQKTHGGVD